MQDLIRDFLKEDKKLLKAYEISEAKYLLSLNKNYESINVELNLDSQKLKAFFKALANNNLCFDEWANNQLKDLIIKKEMEEFYEKTSKRSTNMED